VSSAVDTSVGLAAGVALAAALPDLPYACGLGTMSLLAGDVTGDPLVAEHGELPVRRPVVDLDQLARFEADPAPWRARAEAAAGFLAEAGYAAPSWDLSRFRGEAGSLAGPDPLAGQPRS
jgi:O-succinylbenzoate synthase